MEISKEALNIISIGPNLQRDFSVLQWMQNISQDLENRALVTNESIRSLNHNVEKTIIVLDNATNKLNNIQDTHFVENRVQDDEENCCTIRLQKEDEKCERTQEENLNTFLKKNLKMLNRCHDRYGLELKDNDNMDYMYQPKNPYNDRPLPHIYGSNLWKEKWHVGLCDDNDNISEDGTDEFSKSTSTGRSLDSSSMANVSEGKYSDWNLSGTITTERPGSSNLSAFKEKNSFFHEEIKSQSGSICESVANINQRARRRRSDSFSDDPFYQSRSSPTISSSSKNSSKRGSSMIIPPEFKSFNSSVEEKLEKDDNRIIGRNLNTNLPPFVEKVEDDKPNMRQKPVNLFDDKEFNSFMNQIVSKASAISPQVAKERDKEEKGITKNVQNKPGKLFESPYMSSKNSPETILKFPEKVSSSVDAQLNDHIRFVLPKVIENTNDKPALIRAKKLFEENNKRSTSSINQSPINDIFTSSKKKSFATDTAKPSTLAKSIESMTANKALNLFESPNSSPPKNDDMFSSSKSQFKSAPLFDKTNIRNIFDDDDSDDENDLFFTPSKKDFSIRTERFKGLLDEDANNDDFVSNMSVKSNSLYKDLFPTTAKMKEFEHSASLASETLKNLLEDNQEKHSVNKLPTVKNLFPKPVLKTDQQKNAPLFSKTIKALMDDEIQHDCISKIHPRDDQMIKHQNSSTSTVTNTKALGDDENEKFFVPSTKEDNNKQDSAYSLTAKTTKALFDDDIEDDSFLNLMESQPKNSDLLTVPPVKIIDNKKSGLLLSNTTKALFDDENEDSDFSFRPIEIPKSAKKEETSPIYTKLSAKNLFDDDDDDDDFLNFFAAKKDKNKNENEVGSIKVKLPHQKDTCEMFNKEFEVASERPRIDKNIEKEDALKKSDENATKEINESEKSSQVISKSEQKESTKYENQSESVTLKEEIKYKIDAISKEEPSTGSISKYSNIFQDDVPPSDDEDDFYKKLESDSKSKDNDSPSSFYESMPENTSSNNKTEFLGNNSANYRNLGLFLDHPPDDDFVPAEIEPKRIHSIFYDDFNETRQANESNKVPLAKVPSNYISIFSDEPPSDDEEIIKKNMPIVVNESPTKAESLQKSNVITDVKTLHPRNTTEPIDNFATTDIPTTKRDYTLTSLPVSSEGILPNLLHKNRPHVRAKRRPSTRKARLESYIKSKESSDHFEIGKENSTTCDTISSQNSLFESSTNKEINSKEKKSTPDTVAGKSLFSDDDDDLLKNENIFSYKNKKKIKDVKLEQKESDLFSDIIDNDYNGNEDDNDDFSKLFGKLNTVGREKMSSSTVTAEKQLQQKTKIKNLFTDSEDGEDVFDSQKPKSGTQTNEITDNKKSKTSFQSGAVTTLDDNPLADLLNS